MKKRFQKYLRKIKVLIIRRQSRYYYYLNRHKPSIFLYTDSRGISITKKDDSYNPFLSYPGYLIKNFAVDYMICPEKHTTLVDFLAALDQLSRPYRYVICHAGIVDFSPRHQSVAKSVYQAKKMGYDAVFSEDKMVDHLNCDLGVKYENEPTINMFSIEMAIDSMIPALKSIPNLIWIGCNRFVRGWEGNYFKARPANISLVENYARVFCEWLDYSVDLLDWDDEDIMKYTYDNIHLTPLGDKELLERIQERISSF